LGCLDARIAQLTAGLERGTPSASLFWMALVDSPPLHNRAAELWAMHECAANGALGMLGEVERGERLRVRYFSADHRVILKRLAGSVLWLECAYCLIYERYQAGLDPASLGIKALHEGLDA
jgi:hypothetical protein